jgi:hypothetical protein
MLLLAGVGLVADLLRAGYSPIRLFAFDLNQARHFNSILNRTLNQLTAIAFTTVAIAVPLTANMYSVKFLEFFLKDRVSGAALALAVVAGFNNVLLGYTMAEGFIPVFSLHVVTGFTGLCFALLPPYLFYVFRFLHPNALLARLHAEIVGAIDLAVQRPSRAADLRRAVSESIEHIAEIALRSVDRKDRNTAIESVLVLERAARDYWARRDLLPTESDPQFFLGFSSRALDEISQSRRWVEMKLLAQLHLMLSAAIPSLHDLTGSVAKTLRKLGLESPVRDEPALREMIMEYFNTFVRLALNRRDARSVFTIFDQYRAFAEGMNAEHPELTLEIAFYFGYYGAVAREGGLTFVVESTAHDLAALVRYAWETRADSADALLDRFLHYDEKADPPLPGVKKAQALLASYFLLAGRPDAVARIARSFQGLDRSVLATLKEDMLRVTREKYWEVNERRLNLEYVPEAQRARLHEFLDQVGS